MADREDANGDHAPKISSRKTFSIKAAVLGTAPGRWGILAILLVLYAVFFPDSFRILYLDLKNRLLEYFGYALAPSALWILAFLVLVRFRLRTLFKHWRVFLGSAFLLAAAMGALSFFEAPNGSSIHDHSLGGKLGSMVRGPLPQVDVFRVILFTVIGFWVLAPERIFRSILRIAKWNGRIIRGIWLTIDFLIWSVSALLSWYRGTSEQRGTKKVDIQQPSKRQAFSLASEDNREGSHQSIVTGSTSPRLPVPEYKNDQGPPNQSSKDYSSTAIKRIPKPPMGDQEVQPIPSVENPTYRSDISGTSPIGIETRTSNVSAEPSSTSQGLMTEQRQEIDSVGTRSPRRIVSSAWKLPALSLLKAETPPSIDEQANEDVARLIESSLQQFGVEVTVSQIKPGPTVTQFGLVPGWVRRQRNVRERDDEGDRMRVKVDTILAREKDLALALAVPSLRLEAPVPGESVVGVEVPNRYPALVSLRSAIQSPPFQRIVQDGGLPLALGESAGGEPVALDLLKMPHLLIAGSTGSGKSVCMNVFITSIISQWSPWDLRLVLMDPKRVELTPYNGIPHLAVPVIVEPDEVVPILKGVIQVMLWRYKEMESVGVRNIQAYNRKSPEGQRMPYMVICVDELADMMMVSPYDAEQTLCRLAQLGRAAGIHLIVATQRPSVDVVTGLIKANFPSRISFAVASQIDSRTILDSAGAERLLGRGDMLFLPPDAPKPKRTQGAYILDDDIQRLVNHWRAQNGPPPPPLPLEEMAAEALHENSEENVGRGQSNENIMERALDLAKKYNHLSTSLLQRKLEIGYPRAAKLMDTLEEEGIVGPQTTGGKPRPVIHHPTSNP
jgi:DNA segregation ATPase FtsK/SpoIIIE-like protein